MASILLSIKPEYIERIFAGSKKYEFRKRLANKAVGKILMYSTAPIMKVVGEVQIVETISASPTALWERTKKLREYPMISIGSITKVAKSLMPTG